MELAPIPSILLQVKSPLNMNVYAKFDEIPSMTLLILR